MSPATTPNTSAPRQSRMARTSPWTCRSMTIPTALGPVTVTWSPMTVPTPLEFEAATADEPADPALTIVLVGALSLFGGLALGALAIIVVGLGRERAGGRG